MRKFKYAILGLGFVIAGLTGCKETPADDPQEPPVTGRDVNVVITTDDAKSIAGESAPASDWVAGDRIGVFTTSNNNRQFTIAEGGVTDGKASFAGSFLGVSDDLTVYAYYPWSAYAGNNTKAINCTVPSQQIMTGDTFDRSAEIMVAGPKEVTVGEGDLAIDDVKFSYLVSFVNFGLEFSADDPHETTIPTTETVLNIVIEAPVDKALSGAFTLDLETGAAAIPAAGAADTRITVQVPENTTVGNLSAWAVTKPLALAATDELIVTVNTRNYIITKTITGEALEFVRGEAKTVDLVVDSSTTIDEQEVLPPTAPATLYILGDATEYDAPKAMRKLDDDNFEIYTKLAAGNYNFSGTNDGTAQFTIKHGLLANGEEPIAATEGIYYIKVSFKDQLVTLSPITGVKYHFPSNGNWEGEMTYAGNGVWELLNNYAYSTDERYRFNVTMGEEEWAWGYVDKDSPQRPAETSGTYYRIYPRLNDESFSWQWDYTFKYHESARYRRVNIRVVMSPEAEYYYNSIELIPFNITPAVPAAPASGTAVDLNERGTTDFSWSEGNSSDGEAVTYSLVFYGDENGQNELARITAGNSGTATSMTLGFERLNIIAVDAGIASAQTGDVYWTVATQRAGTEVFAPARNRLTLTRIDGIAVAPDNVFITGDATEYTAAIADAGKLKKTGEGQFEIYTKLVPGTYNFTDAAQADARKFIIDGPTLKEEDGAITVDTEGIYRIRLNFLTSLATVETVDDIQMYIFFSQRKTSLTYVGKGVWNIANYEIILPATGWSWDPYDIRYAFIFTIDGAQERWNRNNSFGERPTIGQEGYGDLKFGTSDSGQWAGDNAPFRMPTEITFPPDKCFVDITVSLTDQGNYTHAMSNLRKE